MKLVRTEKDQQIKYSLRCAFLPSVANDTQKLYQFGRDPTFKGLISLRVP